MRHPVAVVAFSALALAAALPAAAGTRFSVRVGPPAAVVETHPAAPSARHVGVAGYHRWNGEAYVWTPGRWALPPDHHHTWVPGHWR